MTKPAVHTEITILIVLLVFHSCTSTYIKSDSSEEALFYQKVNKNGEQFSAKIILLDGKEHYGDNLSITADSASWLSAETDEIILLRTSEIRTIIFKDHFKGAIGGITAGLIAGLISGFVVVTRKSFEAEHSKEKNLKFLFELSVLTTMTGAVVGGIISEKNEFMINEN